MLVLHVFKAHAPARLVCLKDALRMRLPCCKGGQRKWWHSYFIYLRHLSAARPLPSPLAHTMHMGARAHRGREGRPHNLHQRTPRSPQWPEALEHAGHLHQGTRVARAAVLGDAAFAAGMQPRRVPYPDAHTPQPVVRCQHCKHPQPQN